MRTTALLLAGLLPGCALIDGLTGDNGDFSHAFDLTLDPDADVAVGDFDGDHFDDLAVTRPGMEIVALFVSGNEQLDTDYDTARTAAATGEVFAVDIDNDGKDELVAADYSSTENRSQLSIFDAPTLAGDVAVATVDGAVRAISGDLTEPSGALVALTRDPDQLLIIRPNFGSTALVVSIADVTGQDAKALAVGDFDDDGHVDIAYGRATGFSVLYGQTSGDPYSSPEDIEAGDVTDLAAANIVPGNAAELAILRAYTTQDEWAVTIADSSGNVFGGHHLYDLNQAASALFIAELDGLPPDDIVVFADDERPVRTAFGYSVDGFTGSVDVDIGAVPKEILVGDFDGDGRDDIATVDGTALTAYRNNL